MEIPVMQKDSDFERVYRWLEEQGAVRGIVHDNVEDMVLRPVSPIEIPALVVGRSEDDGGKGEECQEAMEAFGKYREVKNADVEEGEEHGDTTGEKEDDFDMEGGSEGDKKKGNGDVEEKVETGDYEDDEENEDDGEEEEAEEDEGGEEEEDAEESEEDDEENEEEEEEEESEDEKEEIDDKVTKMEDIPPVTTTPTSASEPAPGSSKLVPTTSSTAMVTQAPSKAIRMIQVSVEEYESLKASEKELKAIQQQPQPEVLQRQESVVEPVISPEPPQRRSTRPRKDVKSLTTPTTGRKSRPEKKADKKKPKNPAYRCKFKKCGRCFDRAISLHSHQLKHKEPSAKFSCNICRRLFKTQNHLNQHKVSHDRDRTLECPHCGEKSPKSTWRASKNAKAEPDASHE